MLNDADLNHSWSNCFWKINTSHACNNPLINDLNITVNQLRTLGDYTKLDTKVWLLIIVYLFINKMKTKYWILSPIKLHFINWCEHSSIFNIVCVLFFWRGIHSSLALHWTTIKHFWGQIVPEYQRNLR